MSSAETMPRDAAEREPTIAAVMGDREPAEQIAALAAELAARNRQLAALEAATGEQIKGLTEALWAIRDSTIWRAMGPVRAIGSRLPEPARIALRRLARSVYWATNPTLTRSRKRWFTYDTSDRQTSRRLEALSAEIRAHRLGMPLRRAYGDTAVEGLDIYPTSQRNAPVFVFIHGGGGWRWEEAKESAFPAEMFVAAGAHFVVPDFVGIMESGGNLALKAEQVRRSIAWVYRNAASFGGDPERIFVGGHSSGGHLAGVALVTDWQKDFALPADLIKGGLLMSGLFEMKPVRAAPFSVHIKFTDESEDAMSPQRHLDLVKAPLIITYGTGDSPEFQQQSEDFFAALQKAGKPAELIAAPHFGHMEVAESLASPFGLNGRAALRLMGLSPGA